MTRSSMTFSLAMSSVALRITSLFLALLVSASTVMGGQRFTERPQNSSVVQGRTKVLRCVIRDRAGRVQWVKDGFALGYDRNVPGYSRYSIMGSNRREFNLEIRNATLSDEGDYQCQVTPSGPSHPRLAASAHLTVMVPCDPPMIRDHENATTVQVYANGSDVQVPYTQRSLRLVCEARQGKPAAQIEWFRNDVRVRQNVVHETAPSVGDRRRTDSRSTLSLSLSGNSENGAVYRCQAKNSAMSGPAPATSVTFTILFPPGPPVITGYSSGQAARANSSLQLTCSSTGGNPLGSVVWYRGQDRVDASYTSGNNRAVNTLNITVGRSDDGAVYRCEVTNYITDSALSTSVTLSVHFPPERVTMGSVSSRNLNAGDRVRLTCTSAASNPRTTIRWTAGGQPVSSSSISISNEYRNASGGGQVTVSRARVRLPDQRHDIIYACHASNNVDREVTDSVSLRILHPPNAPTISRNPDSSSIGANQLQRMTCTSVGGNPLATLKWYKNNRLLNSAVHRVVGGSAVSEIGIVAQADDNGAVYTCKARNRAVNQPLETSVTMAVLFPPTSVHITISTDQPRAGQGLNLTCVSSSSNPAAEITWLKAGRRLVGVPRGVVNAQHGGKNSTNVLHIIPTSSDHQASYSCRATNRRLNQSATDAVTLNVLFQPQFVGVVPPLMNITAGQSRRLNVTALANPAVTSYRLRRQGRSTRFRVNSGGVLSISSINKQDGGDFSVTVTNSQGSASLNFSIVVRYKPTISSISTVYADVGGNATLVCRADANPVTPNMITWTRSGFDMNGRSMQSTEGSTSRLTVYNLQKVDAGSFRCSADNGIDSTPTTRSGTIVIKYTPTIDKSPQYAKVAGAQGDTVTLTCRAEGAPAVTFSWYKNNRRLSGRKYRTSSRSRGTGRYEGTLRVRSVVRSDYGNYNCTASNSKGKDSFLVSLHGQTHPDPPYDLRVVNSTLTSVTIGWTPGFDGGLNQSYRIRYKPVQARGFTFVELYTPDAPIFTMKGLTVGTSYEVTALAFNTLGQSTYQTSQLIANTSIVRTSTDFIPQPEDDQVTFIDILIICIVGVFVIALHIGLILFFLRRRQKRLEGNSDVSSVTNTNTFFELYGPGKVHGVMYPPPPPLSDNSPSCGSYDKTDDGNVSEDEGSDDDYEWEPPGPTFHPRFQTAGPPHRPRYIPYSTIDYRVRPSSPGRTGTHQPGVPMRGSPSERHRASDVLYDDRTYPYRHTAHRNVADFSERSPSGRGRMMSTPPPRPPPPIPRPRVTRDESLPPLPPRRYSYQDGQLRYAPPPGSLARNAMVHRSYHEAANHFDPSHSQWTHPQSDTIRGHRL